MAYKQLLSLGFVVDPPYGADFLGNLSEGEANVNRGIDVDYITQATFFVDPHATLTYRQIDEYDSIYDAVASGFVEIGGMEMETTRVLQVAQANIFNLIPDPVLFYIRKPANKLVVQKLITSVFQFPVWMCLLAALLLCSALAALMQKTMPKYTTPRRLITTMLYLFIAIVLEFLSNMIVLNFALPLRTTSYPFSTNVDFMQFVEQGRCNLYSVYKNATYEMELKMLHEDAELVFNRAIERNPMKVVPNRQVLLQTVLNEQCAVAVDYFSALSVFERPWCAQIEELQLVKLIPKNFAFPVGQEKDAQLFARKLATVLASPVMWAYHDLLTKKYGAQSQLSSANCSMLENTSDNRLKPLKLHQLVEAFYIIVTGSCVGILMFFFELPKIMTLCHHGPRLPQQKRVSDALEQNVAYLEQRVQEAATAFVSRHFTQTQSCVQCTASSWEELVDTLLTLIDGMTN